MAFNPDINIHQIIEQNLVIPSEALIVSISITYILGGNRVTLSISSDTIIANVNSDLTIHLPNQKAIKYESNEQMCEQFITEALRRYNILNIKSIQIPKRDLAIQILCLILKIPQLTSQEIAKEVGKSDSNVCI
jgi:hypothetical protein